MQEKIILTERKSRRISVGKILLNVKDLQVALAGGRADKLAIIYAVATKKLKVKGKQISPRRLRAKYTHRTNFVYALRISPLQGAIIAGNGSKFVNGCQCIHSQIIWQNLFCRRQGGSAYRKKFIYSNDKTKQCKRQNHLYIQSCKTGKPLCSL